MPARNGDASARLGRIVRSPDFSRFVILLVMITIMAVLQRNFFTMRALVRNINSFAPLILVTMGQAIIILAGGLDLSVGNALSLFTVLLTAIMREGAPMSGVAALVLTYAVAVAIGIVNGIGIGYFRIPAVIVTYATSFVWLGIALFIRPTPGGETVDWFQAFYDFGYVAGVPPWLATFGDIVPPALILVLVGVAIWAVVARTRTGRYIYAVGSNIDSSYESGINTAMVQIRASVLNMTFVFLAALFFVGQNQTGDARMGDPLTLRAVASALVGGIALVGGSGNIYFAIVGALIFSFVNNIIFFANISSAYQTLFGGVIIIVAITASQFVALTHRPASREKKLS